MIEVLHYDPATRESVVLSALGERADWNRNIQASPPALPSAAGCGAGGRSAGGPSAPLAADSERQGQAIRALLPRAGRTESWLLAKLQIKCLDDLLYARAELVIRRLGEMARERANAQS